jgi:hypothetical protein
MRVILRDIGIVYAWGKWNEIDIEQQMRDLGCLTNRQLDRLIDDLRINFSKARRADEKVRELAPPTVGVSTWAERLASARDYFLWRIDEQISEQPLGTVKREHLRELRRQVYNKITSRIPPFTTGKKQGLEPEMRARLWSIVDPDSPENPFQRCVRKRNHVIVEGLSKIGFRRGEILKNKTGDVNAGRNGTITITTDRDDIGDPRRYEPRGKTGERVIPISDGYARLLDTYITDERARIPGAKRTPYVYVTRNGAPLTLEGLRSIFRQITKRFPEFKSILSPHVLRHVAADLLWAFLREKVLNDAERREIMNYLMGWSETSDQSLKYPRAEIERRAMTLSLDHQRELFARPAETS